MVDGCRMPDGWSDPGRVAAYLSREIPNREIAETLLLDALPVSVDRFLDLGCGDGRLLRLVRSRHPDAHGLGLDSSEPMLGRAETRFTDERQDVELCNHDLSLPLAENDAVAASAPFEAIVSALAIHHLTDERKRSLLAEAHGLLSPGGVFVNLDLVCSASQAQHEHFRRAIGRPEDDPSDRLAPLCDQLGWMRDAGFVEVDCRFKWLEMALMTGRRAPSDAPTLGSTT
jgi:tRNA (cmo5U34)-methyltransferase